MYNLLTTRQAGKLNNTSLKKLKIDWFLGQFQKLGDCWWDFWRFCMLGLGRVWTRGLLPTVWRQKHQ